METLLRYRARYIGDRSIWSFSEIRLLSFLSVFESPNQPCERGGGGDEEGGGGYVKKFYINVSFNTRMHTSHRNVNQVQGAYKMYRKQCSGPRCKILTSIHL